MWAVPDTPGESTTKLMRSGVLTMTLKLLAGCNAAAAAALQATCLASSCCAAAACAAAEDTAPEGQPEPSLLYKDIVVSAVALYLLLSRIGEPGSPLGTVESPGLWMNVPGAA